MTFEFSVPSPAGQLNLSVDPGSSLIFVGANGGGKTRLAVLIENTLKANAHRISAHRALELNPKVAKINEDSALAGLRTGQTGKPTIESRNPNRWRNRMATLLLSDFDFLVQALFADQVNKSLETHKRARAGDLQQPDSTKFEQLVEVWERLLPHRKLHVSGDNIEVSVSDSEERYDASEMSDGERAIFYLIGQTLAAAEDSVLIVDEPELHVHRSIMSKLWDELEAARQDCAFVFITHDLEFAAARVAQKFVIRDYAPASHWTIEKVPDNTGFDEELTTLILGSRRPVLFVEGNENGLDVSIYRCSYPDWTVVPRGSCERVIHAVATFRQNHEFTRIACSGIVDADDRQPEDIAFLKRLGVASIPVSEIENIVLLPDVCRAIAEGEGFVGHDLEEKLDKLKTAIFATLDQDGVVESIVTRYCRRRIDRILKKIDFSDARNVADLTAEYGRRTAALDVTTIADEARARIGSAIKEGDLPKLLANYDDKGLISLAAMHLKNTKLSSFQSWLLRVLRNDCAPKVAKAIRDNLPTLHPE